MFARWQQPSELMPLGKALQTVLQYKEAGKESFRRRAGESPPTGLFCAPQAYKEGSICLLFIPATNSTPWVAILVACGV